MQDSKIAWTHHTFNIAWGCTKISPGCKNCYADTLSSRYGHDVWGPNKPRRILSDKYWAEPLKWNALAENAGIRNRVFSSSMCDILEDHPTITEQRDRLWGLIRSTPFLDWQLLSKRPERYLECLPSNWGDGYPNVWIGTSIESDEYVERAEHIKRIPAVVRFVSYEPALGPLQSLRLDGIDWVIYGGESGYGYRQHDIEWPRAIRQRCRSMGVAFFYKQSPGVKAGMEPELDDMIIREYPEPKRGSPGLTAII